MPEPTDLEELIRQAPSDPGRRSCQRVGPRVPGLVRPRRHRERAERDRSRPERMTAAPTVRSQSSRPLPPRAGNAAVPGPLTSRPPRGRLAGAGPPAGRRPTAETPIGFHAETQRAAETQRRALAERPAGGAGAGAARPESQGPESVGLRLCGPLRLCVKRFTRCAAGRPIARFRSQRVPHGRAPTLVRRARSRHRLGRGLIVPT